MLLLALASDTIAQSLTGSIVGSIRDAQGAALVGATLNLTGKTGATRTTTDARGSYRFLAVEPGRYELRAEAPRFRPRLERGIALAIGEQLRLDFGLELAPLAESVEVVTSAVVDVRSSATRTGLTQDLLFQIPLGRFVPTLISATPGVNGGSTGFTTGNAERGSSAFGGGELGNALLVDGVDTRDPGDEGKWLSISYNTLEEIQVLGPGTPAEYGAFTGAVFNAIRRSGGNRFEGLFEARSTWEALASDNLDAELLKQSPALGDPAVATGLLDLSAQLGGPIRKDRLFFFVSGQRARLDTDPSGPRTSADTLDYRLDAKLTWLPQPQDHVTMGLYYNREDISGQSLSVPSGVATDDLTSSWHKPDWNWYGQWRHVFGTRTLLEAKYTGWTGVVEDRPRVAEPLRHDLATGGYSGGSGFTLTAERQRHQANASLSHHADEFAGSHDFKFGVEVERGYSRNDFDQVGGFTYLDYAGQPYLAYSVGQDVAGHAERESLYAQDAWRAGDRLTLNLGIRFDNYRGRGDSEVVYRSHGLAPRLGLAYDLGGDHRTVLKASFGRYYEALPVSYFEAALPGGEDIVLYLNDGTSWIEVQRIPVSRPARVDPDIRHPHVDEITTGFERALGKGMRFSAIGIWRRSRDFVSLVTPDARFVPAQTLNLLTGAPMTVYGWLDPTATSGFITNPDGFDYLGADDEVLGSAQAFRRYKGLVLVLSRRLAGRWQAQVSYVLSRAEGAVDNDYFESLGGAGPYTSPNRAITNASGLLIHDARHELKVLGSYQVPRIDVALSGFFRAVSGTTYTPFQDLPGVPPDNVRLEPRGSRRTPTRTILDLRLEKVFALGSGRLGVFADLINAFNASTAVSVQDRVPSARVPGFDEPIPFGAPTAILPARQVSFGTRFSF